MTEIMSTGKLYAMLNERQRSRDASQLYRQ